MMRLKIVGWESAVPLLAAAFAAHLFATEPASAYGTGIHERITRNALPFLSGGVLDVIVDGNEDEDQDDEADLTERHGQNCRFRDSAAYANMRYEQIIEALRQPRANDPNRAARLFGHITHGIQDFYSHSNWIPKPPEGLGIRNRLLDSGLGLWTVLDPYTNIFDDVVVIEGAPPDGVSAILPRDAQGRATSGVPTVTDRRIFGRRDIAARRILRDPGVRTYRGLMMSVSGKTNAGNQFCPPAGSDCAIKAPPGRPAEALCLRHGSKRSHGDSAKTFSIESSRSLVPPFRKTTTEGRMNMDGDGGGDYFDSRHYAKLQTQHEWCRLLHLSRDLDPSFGASGLLLGTWVATDSGATSPHLPNTPCTRGVAKRHLVEVSATPAANAPGPVNFVLFRGDFTSSARASVGRQATKTLSICGNTNDTVAAALNRWNLKGPTVAIQVPSTAKSWTVRDHRNAFGGSFSIKVTPNVC